MSGNGSTESIRELNDRLRRENLGGEWMLTRGITTLGIDRVASVVHAVMLFDDFTSDNDPYGEHDCAVMEVEDAACEFSPFDSTRFPKIEDIQLSARFQYAPYLVECLHFMLGRQMV